MQAKSDDISDHFGDEGNHHFKNREFMEALVCYNKALCYAESSRTLAKSFANRSAVYFEHKKYDAALVNINVAQDLDPINPEIAKLGDRRRTCMEMIRASKRWIDDPPMSIEEDPWQMIKLSYPLNPQIPFVVNNVSIRCKAVEGDSEKMTRSLFALESLKAGEIIAIETSMINLVTEVDRYRRCCWCASTAGNMNLIPCLKTASLMFCSLKCRDETYLKMPDNQLYTLIDDSDGANPLIFAGKFKNYLKTCLTSYDLSKGLNDDLRRLLTLCNVKRKNGDESYTKIFHFTYHTQLLNYGYSLVGSLFAHSCDPNVAMLPVDNKFVFYVCRPVKKGETLEICYGTEYFYQAREERLENLYKFCNIACKCDACTLFYPVYLPKREAFVSPMTLCSIKMILQSLHQNWKVINSKGVHNERGKEMCMAQDMIWQLMQELGHYLTYGQFGPGITN